MEDDVKSPATLLGEAGLVVTDDENTAADTVIPSDNPRPAARRAHLGANLDDQGLPATFQAVQESYRAIEALSESEIDNLLTNLGSAQYSWSIPLGRRDDTGPAADLDTVLERLADVRDALADAEASHAATDATVAEIAVTVDSLAEEVAEMKAMVDAGMASMRELFERLCRAVEERRAPE